MSEAFGDETSLVLNDLAIRTEFALENPLAIDWTLSTRYDFLPSLVEKVDLHETTQLLDC